MPQAPNHGLRQPGVTDSELWALIGGSQVFIPSWLSKAVSDITMEGDKFQLRPCAVGIYYNRQTDANTPDTVVICINYEMNMATSQVRIIDDNSNNAQGRIEGDYSGFGNFPYDPGEAVKYIDHVRQGISALNPQGQAASHVSVAGTYTWRNGVNVNLNSSAAGNPRRPADAPLDYCFVCQIDKPNCVPSYGGKMICEECA